MIGTGDSVTFGDSRGISTRMAECCVPATKAVLADFVGLASTRNFAAVHRDRRSQ